MQCWMACLELPQIRRVECAPSHTSPLIRMKCETIKKHIFIAFKEIQWSQVNLYLRAFVWNDTVLFVIKIGIVERCNSEWPYKRMIGLDGNCFAGKKFKASVAFLILHFSCYYQLSFARLVNSGNTAFAANLSTFVLSSQ